MGISAGSAKSALTGSSSERRGKNSTYIWLLAAFLLLGVFARIVHLYDGIGGDHTFRQAHVANEILSLKSSQQGPILEPFEPFNKRFGEYRKVFDTPVFSYFVAKVSDIISMEHVVLAKVVNLLLYVVTSLVLVSLFSKFTKDSMLILTAIFLFSVSPLSIHYFSAVFTDNLPILLSLLSLLFFLRYEESNEPKLWVYSLLAGIASAAIKPPVFFTVALALAFYRAYRYGWIDPLRGRLLLFFTIILISVVLYSVITSYINWGMVKAKDTLWYFGALQDRLAWLGWKPFFIRLSKEFGSPFVFLFFMFGIFKLSVGVEIKYKSLIVSWLMACFMTSLLFFNVHSLHNYYQLPFLPVFVLVSALGCIGVVKWIYGRVEPATARYALLMLLAALSLAWAFDGSRVMTYGTKSSALREAEAKLVHDYTPEDGFVLWEGCSTHPLPLYLATRRGYCVDTEMLTQEKIHGLIDKFHGGVLKGVVIYALVSSEDRVIGLFAEKSMISIPSPNSAMKLFYFEPD